jgi:hypothetical protein
VVGNQESYLENLRDSSDRKASANILLPLEYEIALPE